MFSFYEEFYREISKELSKDFKSNDKIDYKPLILPALTQHFMNYTIITSSEGTGGPILMKVLSMINNTSDAKISRDISLLNTFNGN